MCFSDGSIVGEEQLEHAGMRKGLPGQWQALRRDHSAGAGVGPTLYQNYSALALRRLLTIPLMLASPVPRRSIVVGSGTALGGGGPPT